MDREREVKPTITGKLVLNMPRDVAWLLLLMRKFREAVEMAHHLMRRGTNLNEVQRRLTRYLSNKWYAVSAIKRANLYRDQPYFEA